ncbi:unnamed protein product [Peniophora sp. CBMAI 1063]|nr:unnamed protein product [Peniophora sp. CBMAI 1063]
MARRSRARHLLTTQSWIPACTPEQDVLRYEEHLLSSCSTYSTEASFLDARKSLECVLLLIIHHASRTFAGFNALAQADLAIRRVVWAGVIGVMGAWANDSPFS